MLSFIKLLFVVVLVPGFIETQGQVKYEREHRLKSKDVPKAALRFADSLDLPDKVKWYYEENLEGNSVELKYKQDGKHYSIEFYTNGEIQDVEVEIDYQEISEQVRKTIISVIDSKFTKHQTDKVQIQFSGNREVLIELVNGQSPSGTYKTNYELVVRGKTIHSTKLYEMTFNDVGELIKTSKITSKNAVHLEY